MASTSDGSSFIERDSTPANGKCANCGSFTRANDRIRCTLCHRFTHRDCVRNNAKLTDNVLKHLSKPTTIAQPFGFVCAICIPNVSIKNDPIAEKIHGATKNALKLKTNEVIKDLQAKLVEASDQIRQKEIELQNQNRRIQIISESTSSGDLNIAVTKFNEQIAAIMATIEKLTAERELLHLQNREKSKLIEELQSVDMSSTVTGHTAKRPRTHSEDLQDFVNSETLLQTMKDLITPMAQSIKSIEDKQRDLEKVPQPSFDNPTLITVIQNELAPFKELLSGLSSNQEKLKQTMETLKSNSVPRPVNEQIIAPNVNTGTSLEITGRPRPTVIPLALSYAQAVAKSTIPADAIRNVTLNGTPEHMEFTAGKIKKEKLPSDVQISSIISEG